MAAGTFVGQIATGATAEVDLRLPPGITAAQALTLVEGAVGDVASVRVRELKGWDANWTAPDAALTRAWEVASHVVDRRPGELRDPAPGQRREPLAPGRRPGAVLRAPADLVGGHRRLRRGGRGAAVRRLYALTALEFLDSP